MDQSIGVQVLVPRKKQKKQKQKKKAPSETLMDTLCFGMDTDEEDSQSHEVTMFTRTGSSPTPPPEEDSDTSSTIQDKRRALAIASRRRLEIASAVLDESMCLRILLTDISCWTVDVEVYDCIKASINHMSLQPDLCWSLLEKRILDTRLHEDPSSISHIQCQRILQKKLPIIRKAKAKVKVKARKT